MDQRELAPEYRKFYWQRGYGAFSVSPSQLNAALEYIEKQSIQNKRNLESDGVEFGQSLRHIAADKSRTYDYLLRVSMIASLRRAQELG